MLNGDAHHSGTWEFELRIWPLSDFQRLNAGKNIKTKSKVQCLKCKVIWFSLKGCQTVAGGRQRSGDHRTQDENDFLTPMGVSEVLAPLSGCGRMPAAFRWFSPGSNHRSTSDNNPATWRVARIDVGIRPDAPEFF
jgi:hypothetical protein